MIEDSTIQKTVKEILLKEPKYQHANMIYQLVWRYWEMSAKKGKELYALSREGFIDLNVRFGTVESVIRARRKVLEELGVKEMPRYEMAQKHLMAYKPKVESKNQ